MRYDKVPNIQVPSFWDLVFGSGVNPPEPWKFDLGAEPHIPWSSTLNPDENTVEPYTIDPGDPVELYGFHNQMNPTGPPDEFFGLDPGDDTPREPF